MKKLEKSVRHELKTYGPDLRNGHIYNNASAGLMTPGVDRFLDSAFASVDADRGIVTDIRFYFDGEAIRRDDYYGETVCITDQVCDWISDKTTWDDLIDSVVRAVEAAAHDDGSDE